MKILFISAVMPYPLYSGGQIRIYNLLKKLSKKHEITLLTFSRQQEDDANLKKLDFVNVKSVFRGYRLQFRYVLRFLQGESLLLASYNIESMKEMISQQLKQTRFDIIHLEPFYVLPSLPQIGDIPLVIAEHNVEYQVYDSYTKTFAFFPLKPLFTLETKRIKAAEIYALKHADSVIAVSRQDAVSFSRYIPKQKITVVPNGVDLEYFPYSFRPNKSNPVLLFVGDFKWLPNREALNWLVSRIWPAIKTKVANAKLRIVGRAVPRKYITSSYPSVEFDSEVVEIRREYEGASVLIAPLTIGGGSKYKIIEAMASGLPVLTTNEGLSGLKAKPEVHALTAKTPLEFAILTKKLLDDPNFAAQITRNARKLVESSYSWDTISTLQSEAWEHASKIL